MSRRDRIAELIENCGGYTHEINKPSERQKTIDSYDKSGISLETLEKDYFYNAVINIENKKKGLPADG